jgi:hypothetical protein
MSEIYAHIADVQLTWNGAHGSYSASAIVCAETPFGRAVVLVYGTQQDNEYDPREHRALRGGVETFAGRPIDWTDERAVRAVALARTFDAQILVYHDGMCREDRRWELVDPNVMVQS